MGWLDWHKEGDLMKNKRDIMDDWNIRCLARFLDYYIANSSGYHPYKPEDYTHKWETYALETVQQQKNVLTQAKCRLGELSNEEEYKLMFRRMGIEEGVINKWQS